ncbi:hypothetical protein [Pseudoduganella sp. HUAS MS19]
MKTLAASAAALALLCSASALAGEELTVRVPAPGSYTMQRSEFRDYAYSYELSNGKSIRLSQFSKRFFAQLEDEPRAELFPVAPGVLVTAAGARLEFNGDGSALAIRNYERLAMAAAAGGSNITVLASR